jgi:selenocysteine-specific elongation factor
MSAAAAPGAAKVADPELARHLERKSRLVRLGGGYAVTPAAYERARELVASECAAAGSISLARFRDLAGCGRRDAQLLLERLDADGVTRRLGEARVLRRAASRST